LNVTKLNQIGTLAETVKAIEMARRARVETALGRGARHAGYLVPWQG